MALTLPCQGTVNIRHRVQVMPRTWVPRESHPPTALTAPQAGRGLQLASGMDPTGASTAVTGQMSDALKQLSLAVDTNTGEKTSGMLFWPEWYCQHKVKYIQ